MQVDTLTVVTVSVLNVATEALEHSTRSQAKESMLKQHLQSVEGSERLSGVYIDLYRSRKKAPTALLIGYVPVTLPPMYCI